MKYLLTSLALIQFVFINAQDPNPRNLKRTSFGLYASPAIGYRNINSSANEGWLKELRNENEVPAFSFSFGGSIDYRLSSYFSLQSGLIFSSRAFKTKKTQVPEIPDIEETFISFRYSYLDIPLKLKYDFPSNGRWRSFLSGGIITALYIGETKKNHVKRNGEWNITDDKLTFFGGDFVNFFFTLEPGVEYQLSNRLLVRSSLTVQQALKGVNSNLATKDLLQSAGFGFGIVYNPYKRNKR